MSATSETTSRPANGRTSRYGRPKRTTPSTRPKRDTNIILMVTEKERDQLFAQAAGYKTLAAYMRARLDLPETPQE